MSDSNSSNAAANAEIVDHYDLRFDAADPLNGSLYLCTPRGAPRPAAAIRLLQGADLWSAEPEKAVADDQREAYKNGLIFVAAAAYSSAEGDLLLARFDHPKYPSNADRWSAWLALFDHHYESKV